MELLLIKITLTIFAVLFLCVIAGLALSNKFSDWLFPEPQITCLGDVLPFHAIDKDIILGKSGECSQILKITGYDAGSKTTDELEGIIIKKQRWLDKLSDNKATFKILTIRRERAYNLESGDVPEMLKRIHNAWSEQFKTTYHNTHYLIVTVSQAKEISFFQSLKKSIPVPNIGRLKDLIILCQDMLSDFKLEVVENGKFASADEWSDLMSLLHELASDQLETLRPSVQNVGYQIGSHVRFVKDSELIQYDHSVGKIISLNKWGDAVSGATLKEIQSLSSRLIILQMFNAKGKHASQKSLEYQRKQKQISSRNEKLDVEYDKAINCVKSDLASLYNYQLSILVLREDESHVDNTINQIKRILIGYGKTPVIEVKAKEWIWRSMFPGVDWMVRPTTPLSFNLVCLINFNSEPEGLEQCDWGQGALRPFKTASGSAYSLQLHISDEKEALAHSVVVAPAGSGKTTLFEHLVGGALRHQNLRAFIFDRLNGTKIFTQAVNGNYVDFSDEVVVLNPFYCEATEDNKAFLQMFLQMLTKCEDDQSVEEASLAVEQILSIPKEQRILTNCFQDIARKDSVFSKGLCKWASDVSLSRWFNGNVLDAQYNRIAFDALDLNSSRLTAFEMTKIQERPDVAAAVTTYLMYRIRTLGKQAYPHMIFIDETQPMMEDPVFSKQVGILLKEHRKLRGSVSLCFQDVNAVNSVILEQCQTRFLFPNASASKEAYAKFELTDFEWDYIKGFSRISRELKRSVLVKKPGESVILNIDMSSLGKLLQLYRSGAEPVKIVKELQQQWGMKDWVPHYLNL
jgi:type IV secretion system protein VirB4